MTEVFIRKESIQWGQETDIKTKKKRRNMKEEE
jgi:hypothetical protein